MTPPPSVLEHTQPAVGLYGRSSFGARWSRRPPCAPSPPGRSLGDLALDLYHADSLSYGGQVRMLENLLSDPSE